MESIGFTPPNLSDSPYTISEINNTIANVISDAGALVWLEGEVSSFKKHSSGHCYLRLKDSYSQIPAVIWKSNATKISTPIEEGMQVVAVAVVRVYERGGYYQLDIQKISPAGDGDEALRLELLKEKLTKEGLFDEDRKRELPENIQKIAVITAKTGAAYHDIVNVIARNAPYISITLCSATVQGEFAPKSLVTALKNVNDYSGANVIIFGRGGGSSEDLSCFNDESVVRAVVASKIPVISAVGHEVDFSFSDFAADIRAATPSVAAEIVITPHIRKESYFNELKERFSTSSVSILSEKFRSIHNITRAYPFKQVINRVLDSRIALDNLKESLYISEKRVISKKVEQFKHSTERLNLANPLSILSRGFGVLTNGKGDRVNSIKKVALNETITARMSDGIVEAKVTAIREV